MPQTRRFSFASADEARAAANHLIAAGFPIDRLSGWLPGAPVSPRPIGAVDAAGVEVRRKEVESDLNPAQNDYPRTGSASPTEFSSKPPNAQRDYNPGLDKHDYNAGYQGTVDEEMRRDLHKDRARANETGPESDFGTGRESHGRAAEIEDPIFRTGNTEPGPARAPLGQGAVQPHLEAGRAHTGATVPSTGIGDLGLVLGQGAWSRNALRTAALAQGHGAAPALPEDGLSTAFLEVQYDESESELVRALEQSGAPEPSNVTERHE